MAARKQVKAIRTFQRYKAWAIRKEDGGLSKDVYEHRSMAGYDALSDSHVVRVEVTVRVIAPKKRGKR